MYGGTIPGKKCPCCKQRRAEKYGNHFYECQLCEQKVCVNCLDKSEFGFDRGYDGDYGMQACSICWEIYYSYFDEVDSLRIEFNDKMRELRKQCQEKCKKII